MKSAGRRYSSADSTTIGVGYHLKHDLPCITVNEIEELLDGDLIDAIEPYLEKAQQEWSMNSANYALLLNSYLKKNAKSFVFIPKAENFHGPPPVFGRNHLDFAFFQGKYSVKGRSSLNIYGIAGRLAKGLRTPAEGGWDSYLISPLKNLPPVLYTQGRASSAGCFRNMAVRMASRLLRQTSISKMEVRNT